MILLGFSYNLAFAYVVLVTHSRPAGEEEA